MTNHFTFFASYYDSIEHLDNDLKAEFLDVLLKYALRDESPKEMTPVVQALFTMAKPNLDQSKARRKAGAKGGKQTPSKPEANRKQIGSKPEAPLKQPPSDKEKEKEEDKEVKTTSPEDEEQEIYKSKKGRILKGDTLKSFLLFWDVFNYKSGKAEAADSWYDLKPTNGTMSLIIAAAKKEATGRAELKRIGRTPKMAQGWLSGRRFEDETTGQDEKLFCSSCDKFCKHDSPDHCHQNGGTKACNNYSKNSK